MQKGRLPPTGELVDGVVGVDDLPPLFGRRVHQHHAVLKRIQRALEVPIGLGEERVVLCGGLRGWLGGDKGTSKVLSSLRPPKKARSLLTP